MVEAFRCSQCSAAVTDDRWTNCPYCGAVLAKPTINPLRAVVAPERFASVERSPGYTQLMSRTPSSTGEMVGFGFRTVFLVVFVLVSGAMTVAFLAAGPLALVPGFICGVGVVMLVRSSQQAATFAKAELERTIAVWRDERTEVSDGGKNSSARTDHFVLLEDREGRRVEFPCDARLAGAHAPGDIGIAYLRGGVLLDFVRVDA
jgi:DNA-directed RNA polymerase subunit RPC12/RpoP